MNLKKDVALCMVLILVLSTFSVGFVTTSADNAETTDVSDDFSSGNSEKVLSDDLKERVSSKAADERIEVVIRLTPHEFDDREPLETPLNEVDTGEVVAGLKDHAERKQSEVIDVLEKSDGEVINTFWIANTVLAEVNVGDLNVLAEHEGVWKIHENFKVETQDSTASFGSRFDRSDPPPSKDHDLESSSHKMSESSDNLTWGLDRINAVDVWGEGTNGSSVRVAVSDSGVDIDHPDLEGKMVTVDDDDPHYPGGWIEFNSTGHIVEDSVPHSNGSHGTHVSGTLVGGNASGTQIGVAPDAELMHALVLPEGNGTFSQLLAGLEWKVEPHDRFGNTLEPVEEHRPHIASMSWGASGYQEDIEEPIKNMKNAGIVPVAAIGNSGEGRIGTPGAIYEAFGIGASNITDKIPGFSSGAVVEDEREDTPEEYVKPDFAAPGVEVKSSVPGEGWEYMSGTSMATPHVAGTVALMLEANPDLSIEEIYHALEITADHHQSGDSLPGEDKNTRYGHGIIDAHRSVDAAMGNPIIRGSENISRHEATLKGEVLRMPDEEMDVFFRYRKRGEKRWSKSETITLTEPQVFEGKIGGLEKATTYEYKLVGVREKANETTFSLTFTTHDDVEISTLPATNLTEESALLRGEVTEMYLEEVSIFFKYRGRNGEGWNETDLEIITEASSLKFELDLKKLEDSFICEYKAVAISSQGDFTGDLLDFPTGAIEPEWDKEEEAYLITNIGELQWMRKDLENDYILQNDIDGSWTRDWPAKNDFECFRPIGNGSERFNGTLKGQGHVIEDFYLHRTYELGSWDFEDIGLFGVVGKNGTIDNVGIDGMWIGCGRIKIDVGGFVGRNYGKVIDSFVRDGDVRGERAAGVLVGINEGKVTGSYTTGSINAASTHLGGLIGRNTGKVIDSYSIVDIWNYWDGGRSGGLIGSNSGYVSDSHAAGKIEMSSLMGGTGGGLIGTNTGKVNRSFATGGVVVEEGTGTYFMCGGLIGSNSGNVSESYATGDVDGAMVEGGLVGWNTGDITKTYAMGDIEGYIRQERGGIGGLIGRNGWDRGNETGYVDESYSVGNVSSIQGKVSRLGGLVGRFEQGDINESYWDMERSGMNESDGGIGLTTNQMTGNEAIDNMTGFDFDKTWRETVKRKNGEVGFEVYPILQSLDRVDQINPQGGTIITLPVEDKDLDSALLKGELVDIGFSEEVELYFYWRKKGETEWEARIFVETMEDPGVFGHRLENLSLGSSYEYYVYGEGVFAYAEGDIQTFKITQAPTVETVSVGKTTYDSAVLQGELLDLGTADDVSVSFQYREKYGQDEWMETSSKTLTEPTEFEIDVQALQPNTTYEVRARAVGDEEDLGETVNFTTEELPTYELTIESSEGGQVLEPGEGSFEYDHGTEVKLEAVADEYYHLVEWTGDVENIEDLESSETTIEILDNYTITADFAVDTYTLEIDSTLGGEVVEPGEGTFKYEGETMVNLEAAADERHHFVGWTGDTDVIEDPTDEQTTIEMLDNHTITAEFGLDEYELNISVEGEGSTEPGEGNYTYEYGEEVPLKAFPEEGWTFSHWSGNVTEDQDEITVTINDNMDITAHFVEEPYFEVQITAPEDGEKFDDDEEEIVIEYTVKNTGGIEDVQTIEFTVNGEVEGSEKVTLGSDEEYNGEFTWKAEENGDFDIGVRSADGTEEMTIQVVEEDAKQDDYGWLFAALGFIAVGILVVLVWVKKNKEQAGEEE